MEAVELPVELDPPGGRGKIAGSAQHPQVHHLHLSPPLPEEVRDGGRSSPEGIIVPEGWKKRSFENCHLGDAFIMCLESSQTTAEMKKACSSSA